jgi:class 3 adenylate cyclase
VIRVTALYDAEPDADRYEQHAELCRRVPGAIFRHGKVLRKIAGDRELAYYAEFEFPDMEAFKVVAPSEELTATGKDAAEMGLPHSVYLIDLG